MPRSSLPTPVLQLTRLSFRSNDGGCADYNDSPPYVPTDDSCYSWEISGTNSANIGYCAKHKRCTCVFYTETACGGNTYVAVWKDFNCVSRWGYGFKSFSCTVQ